MERTGTLPEGFRDLSRYQPLLEAEGPVATIALVTEAAMENAGPANELRAKDMLRSLAEAGVPEVVVEAVLATVPDAHRAGEGLAVYANSEGLLHLRHSPVPPRQELARWDTLASLSVLLDWDQHQPRYVVALVDHTGADLMASGAGTPDRYEEAGSERYPVARNAPGGWSQRRYQQHAMDNWDRNAHEVAAALSDMAAEVRPDVILLGGDPRTVGLLKDALAPDLSPSVATVPGARAADGGGDNTAREVARLVETEVARRTVAALEEFRLHLGRGDRAVEGVEATFDALRQGRVSALLIHDDPDDGRRAWFGAEPGTVGVSAGDLEGVGSGPVGEGRLVDVALRGAVGTSAGVRLVPRAGGPAEGIGALLRWGTE